MATNRNLASLAVTTLGLGIAFSILGAGAPPAPPAHSSAHAVTVTEDDPGFDCLTMGNFYCGDPEGVHATEAWAAWDKTQAWKQLQVPATLVRVEYVGYAKRHPNVDVHTELAVPSRDGWYVFRGVLTAGEGA